jgi:hypothetical protein
MRRAALVALLVLLMWPRAADAMCMAGSDDMATVDEVFVGVALDAPTALDDNLVSPARFEVVRWVKGDGAAVVEVPTAVSTSFGGGITLTEDDITPRPGERWLVMLRNGSATCTGSRVLRRGEEAPSAEESTFPPALAVIAVVIVATGASAGVLLLRRRVVG